jgi:hypothetical protein
MLEDLGVGLVFRGVATQGALRRQQEVITDIGMTTGNGPKGHIHRDLTS